jgi:small subunit ribosomal protein S8
MVKDPISNLINGLSNASKAKKDTVVMPSSKLLENVCKILKEEQYIDSFEVTDNKGKKTLTVNVKYTEGVPAVTAAKRLSKQSQRLYSGAKSLRPVKNGYGIMVLTTPKGLMTGRTAKKMNIGGETLFIMW